MQRKKFSPEKLRSCLFTDPFWRSMRELDEIIKHHKNGTLKEPYLIKYQDGFLIFNGNHRILVSINNHFSIYCKIIENDEDLLIAQSDDDRDMKDVVLTLPNVLKHLIESAKQWSSQNPQDYDY